MKSIPRRVSLEQRERYDTVAERNDGNVAGASEEDGWLRPGAGAGLREPRWGHPNGIQLGLDPADGPRGLLRIFTPYLDQPRDRLINFVAIEPIPLGQVERGYSELEMSGFDGVRGLRFWSADDPDDLTPREPFDPSRGRVSVVDGVERLEVDILSEPFANGADVWVRATFRKDRPHEIELASFARSTSVDLDVCILSATMGNWARLRVLQLADREVTAGELWPTYRDIHFVKHARFALDELSRDEHGVSVSAFPDEASPRDAEYASGTSKHWEYVGRKAVQTWRAEAPDPSLIAQVNGRFTYWMSDAPIPGGIAFENFELVESFRQGRTFTFAVEPLEASDA